MKTAFVSIIGRTNVGKSTLLNAILGEKISIISDKPQTTRSRIVGVYNDKDVQIAFIDTPGFHRPENKLGAKMVEVAEESIGDVDLLLFVAECRAPGSTEREVLRRIAQSGLPCILVLNKIDKVRKDEILKVIAAYAELHEFDSVVPISALQKDGVKIVLEEILKHTEDSDIAYYPTDAATDRSERYLASELVREKLLRNLREEVPHGTAVETVLFRDREDGNLTEIYVNIICERESHKGIIIGKQGTMLKKIATEARSEIENLLGRKVYLECRVKVKEDWRNNESLINEYNEF
ncbi:MAG: GTPase Era [Clostridia bacterium]|nr:GTPase Era [Clostridia bacterium]MBQ4324000.1 GTPase Era [Clostridia bacterium]